MSDKTKWVCVFKSNSKFEAQLVEGNLQANNIPCVIINKQDITYLAFGYVEVHVPEEFKIQAEDIINEQTLE